MSAVDTEIHKSRWTGERIGRLGFLLGLGWDSNRIADDPIIASTPNNVHRQAQRFGLAFRGARVMRKTISYPTSFWMAAKKRGITVEMLIDKLLMEISTEPNLIDNILDDGVEDAA